MGTHRRARSTRKQLGFFTSGASLNPLHFVLSKRSPHTNDSTTARKTSSGLNALLEGAHMSDRKELADKFLQHTISPWMLPGGA